MALKKVRKVGGQIAGGSTNLGRLGQRGTTGRAGTTSSKKSLGASAMLNRNLAAMEAVNSRNLSRRAHT